MEAIIGDACPLTTRTRLPVDTPSLLSSDLSLSTIVPLRYGDCLHPCCILSIRGNHSHFLSTVCIYAASCLQAGTITASCFSLHPHYSLSALGIHLFLISCQRLQSFLSILGQNSICTEVEKYKLDTYS